MAYRRKGRGRRGYTSKSRRRRGGARRLSIAGDRF